MVHEDSELQNLELSMPAQGRKIRKRWLERVVKLGLGLLWEEKAAPTCAVEVKGLRLSPQMIQGHLHT